MEWRLISINLCSCNNLTWIPEGNHLRMKKGRVWEFFFSLWAFLVEVSKREYEWRDMGGIYTLSHKKLAVGERVPGYSRYMSGYSGYWGQDTPDSEKFTDGEQLPRDSGDVWILCPDIPVQYPDTPGSAGDFTTLRVQQEISQEGCLQWQVWFSWFLLVLLSTTTTSTPVDQSFSW
jgi:hypothetical protein